jgi:hypothetical protein
MLPPLQDKKILDSVVTAITIQVMHDFAFEQWAS